jgi:acetylornithine deacetylase
MKPLHQTLADLVRINSVNPAYGDGGSEGNVVPYLRSFFASRGIETFEQEVFPGRANLIARIPGRTTRRIVLEAHTDTVSVKGMEIDPFGAEIREGKLYGRGSVDDKAGLAAMMHAVASLKADGVTPECEVWLAAVVDEEFSYRGVVRLCEGLRAEAAIVAEPTEMRLVTATKGVLRFRIVTRGLAAHSSKPHLGHNAISDMARVILAFEAENERLASEQHPLLGPATVNVGVVRGGVQVNLVPNEAAIEVDRRLLPNERAEDVASGYEALLHQMRASHRNFDGRIERPLLLVDEALDTNFASDVVRHSQRLLSKMNRDPSPCGVPFGSDASKLSRAGIPAVVFGPGSINQAHAVDEFVELAQVEEAQRFYRSFIESYP